MKKIILLIYVTTLLVPVFSQNIPNGGFENVIIDTVFPGQSYPLNWMPFTWLPNIECFPYLEQQGELSEDSNIGQFAIRMETQGCDAVGNGLQHRASGYYTGTPGLYAPYSFAHTFEERPETLTFYYKYHKENDDSAFVQILLFNYDTVTLDIPNIERIDTIAYSIGFINEETSEYNQYLLLINYISDSIPEFIKIVFGSGKNCTLPTCTPGTTLWVDDVSVSGGTVGIQEDAYEESKITVYPNPTSSYFRIETKNGVQVKEIAIFDCLGKEMSKWDTLKEEFNIQNYEVGIYHIRILTSNGIVLKKLIKR